MFIADYKIAELRTLAAVCLGRFGYSRLGEVIKAGIDPYVYTVAMLQGVEIEEFAQLSQTEPIRYEVERQVGKAITLGVPGGLGPEMLCLLARQDDRVNISTEEAARFRDDLIHRIYPEWNDEDGYLSDQSMPALARSLGISEDEVLGSCLGLER